MFCQGKWKIKIKLIGKIWENDDKPNNTIYQQSMQSITILLQAKITNRDTQFYMENTLKKRIKITRLWKSTKNSTITKILLQDHNQAIVKIIQLK